MSVGHLVHVDLIEHDADAHAGPTLVVVDENEFAAFGFGDVAEKMALLVLVFLFHRR